jgi:hypothetical protein
MLFPAAPGLMARKLITALVFEGFVTLVTVTLGSLAILLEIVCAMPRAELLLVKLLL